MVSWQQFSDIWQIDDFIWNLEEREQEINLTDRRRNRKKEKLA